MKYLLLLLIPTLTQAKTLCPKNSNKNLMDIVKVDIQIHKQELAKMKRSSHGLK